MNLDLNKFMIFNCSEGRDEGHEREKLIYHWTKDSIGNGINIDEQIDDICMCDASITTSFTLCSGLLSNLPNNSDTLIDSLSKLNCSDQNYSVQSLTVVFDSTVVIMVEVEPEQSIWMAVHVAQSQTIETTEPSNTEGNRQLDVDTIPSDAVKQVVMNIYQRFCLINGTFCTIADSILKSNENQSISINTKKLRMKELRAVCERHFSTALAETHLSSIISNVASLHNYLIYLDLHHLTLMKVVSFLNTIVCIDATQILNTIAIFNDQLIWSSLASGDTRALYSFLVSALIREALEEELVKETDKVRLIANQMPIYLESEPYVSLNFSNSNGRNQKRLNKYYLTVFRSSNNLTIGLIFREPNQAELIQKCEQFLTTNSKSGVPPIVSLAKTVGQNFLKTNALSGTPIVTTGNSIPSKRKVAAVSARSTKTCLPSDHRYLCLDRLSFSVSSLFSIDTQGKEGHLSLEGLNSEVSSNRKSRLVKYLLVLEPELLDIYYQTGTQVEEYLAKTTSDIWLTILNDKYQSVYSIYKLRNAGLSEAQKSAMQLKSTLISSRS